MDALTRRHFRVGWTLLALFVCWGVVLDFLHGFKIGFYLDADAGTETRRFMWTLAHAHGVGLGLLQLGFGATLHSGMLRATPRLLRQSTALIWASVLIPLGFFLGGVVTHGSDPAIGVFLVPVGAVLLMAACIGIALELRARTGQAEAPPDAPAAEAPSAER